MAYNANSRSERLLQSRRFTTQDQILVNEAFTDVLDLGAGEIYTDDGLIPTGSSQLPFSGSGQSGLIVSASVVDPSTYTEGINDLPILKYYYRHALKGAGNNSREVFYFTTQEPSTYDDYVGSEGIIEADQETNFISPKYVDPQLSPSHANRTTEEEATGYKVVVSAGPDAGSATILDAANYVWDFKTGILSFIDNSEVGATDFVYISVYQYVGRTLRSQIDDGSIGGGSDFTAASITGSWTPMSASFSTRVTTNETDITNLQTDSGSFSTRITTLEGNEVHTAAAISGSTRIYVSGSNGVFDVGQDSTLKFVSGTAGITVLSDGTDTITIGASTDDVTFNSVTADTLTGTASFAEKVTLAIPASSVYRPLIISSDSPHNGELGVANQDSGKTLEWNPSLGYFKINDKAVSNSHLIISKNSLQAGPSIPTFNFFDDSGAVSTINFGTYATTTINMGVAGGTVNIAGSASIAGDLIVQGAVTSINTTELNVEDQFILLNSGSATLKDSGIIVSSGPNNSGSAFYYDADSNRWALTPKNSTLWNVTSETPKQYVVSVSASAAAPPTNPLDFGAADASYLGMMHINSDSGDIYIYS